MNSKMTVHTQPGVYVDVVSIEEQPDRVRLPLGNGLVQGRHPVLVERVDVNLGAVQQQPAVASVNGLRCA